ncbi:OmpH family outer membrane protein [Candidatus Levibacter sp. Uisw_134_01]|uniref:OmpH family outer membrane protein n=1 Tax=Candidatus Levibacter sp. Uisw_134_01 TaxID=3230999 RepID=UPI003D470157
MLFLNIVYFINIIENNQIVNTDIINIINNSESSFYPIPISNTVNIDKIGIVDFRYILKKSNAIKVLGDKFIFYEKKINEKIKLKQKELKIEEKKILSRKNKLTDADYKNKLNLFKSEVFEVQKKYKEDRLILNNSFQTFQKKLKDLLAQVIKDVSKKREINVVFLKENVFLFNDPSIDLTNEVLDLFNKKTKSMSITITLNDKPF